MPEIESVIRKLGIYSTLKGFHYIVYAVYLVQQDSKYLQYITKRLYPQIASHFNTTTARVERNIRNAIVLMWDRGNRGFLNEIAGYKLMYKPNFGELIDMIVSFMKQRENYSLF